MAEFLFQKRRQYRNNLAPFAERKRKRELASVRDLTSEDAKQLLETGLPPKQLVANVVIASGIGVAKAYMFEFGYQADDAFKMLNSIDVGGEMCDLVEKGVKETEERRWKSRHGLDKHGKKEKISLYVVNDDIMSAKEVSKKRLLMIKKTREKMKVSHAKTAPHGADPLWAGKGECDVCSVK